MATIGGMRQNKRQIAQNCQSVKPKAISGFESNYLLLLVNFVSKIQEILFEIHNKDAL